MDQRRFDTVTRALAASPSRRTFLVGLAGGAYTLGVSWLPDAVAARKKKKKRKKRSGCRRGQRVGAVSVPGTGALYFTPVLKLSQRYRLRASGAWTSNLTNGQDAFADFPIADPTVHTKFFAGVRLGLSVGGGSPDGWGSYTPSHVYEREVIGQGAALSLRCNDVVHADNSGTVEVEVFCA
jgi:hypothetical protein